jgi:hypothetical protein
VGRGRIHTCGTRPCLHGITAAVHLIFACHEVSQSPSNDWYRLRRGLAIVRLSGRPVSSFAPVGHVITTEHSVTHH